MRRVQWLFAALLTVAMSAAAYAERVPVDELSNLDDSCRSYLLVFTENPPSTDGQFLLDSVKAYGFGQYVRYKHVTPSNATAYADWSAWHQNKPTILTLSKDQRTVMSIARVGGGVVASAERTISVPDLPAASGEPVDRQIALASELVLETAEGDRGRLFDPSRPPFWLPYRRWEAWHSRCPDKTPEPKPEPTIIVQPAQPSDELLAELRDMNKRQSTLPWGAMAVAGLLAIPAGIWLGRYFIYGDE